jgi:RNA recognition motif-containing protein
MANEEAKLFVAGLPDSISEDVLKQLFEATGGQVVGVSLPKDRTTGRPRGFGFVTLATPAEAQAARDALDGSMQAGRSISVRPFQAEPPRRDGTGGPRMGGPPGAGGPPRGPGGGPQAPDRTLYVGNLPYDATQEEVQVLVNGAVADSVVRVHLPTDADGRKRGFGFVTMSSTDTAKTAADALRSADLRGRRLVVNLAHPKGERPARPEGGGGGGGGYGGGAPFPPAFAGGGGGGPGGPPRHKPHEERRKRTFEDGGGPKKKRERDAPRGGGGRIDYDKDED